jgi:uncharacterized protein YjcR
MKYPNIGKSIRIAQAMNDVKNIDLAEKFDVKPQQVVRWRSNEDMSIHQVQTFADYFGMSLSEFVSLADAKS